MRWLRPCAAQQLTALVRITIHRKEPIFDASTADAIAALGTGFMDD
jgi:hypothetical protein